MEQNPDIYWKHHVPISRKLGQLEKKKKKEKKEAYWMPFKTRN
jgi:hypothetical protein